MYKHYRKFLTSLAYAVNGIRLAIRYEVNMRIHLFFAVLAVSLALFFRISEQEWLHLLLTIALVLFAELMNTALEANVDLATKKHRAEAKIAKDAAAGAVLITSLNALATGWILFGSRILTLIN